MQTNPIRPGETVSEESARLFDGTATTTTTAPPEPDAELEGEGEEEDAE